MPFSRKLTKAEMEEQREKGLCFNCDEVYSRSFLTKRGVMIRNIQGDYLGIDYGSWLGSLTLVILSLQ